MSFKKLRTFVMALAVFAGSATLSADDCCYSPCCCECPPCWNGLYLSGQLGGGWSQNRLTFENANYFNTVGDEIVGSKFKVDSSGFVGGGALGYNYQYNSFVVGVEGGALGMSLTKTNNSKFFPETDRFTSKVNCLGFAKVRLGYAFDCVLAYVSGGWAGGNVHVKLHDTEADVRATSNKWVNGWTVGAGVEYKFCDCWSIGLGYDYMSFENKRNTSCPDCGEGVGFGAPRLKSDVQLQTLMVRINYYFNL